MVNPKWCEEALSTAVQRLIGVLSATNLTTLGRPYEVDLWFSCCLPLIKAVIEAGNTANTDKIIQILVSVGRLHSSDDQVGVSCGSNKSWKVVLFCIIVRDCPTYVYVYHMHCHCLSYISLVFLLMFFHLVSTSAVSCY